MKQPKIKIFGQIYKVIQIEFDKKTGRIDKIVYQVDEHKYRTVFRSDEMLSSSLTSKYKVQKPTFHPYHEYAYAPELECLFVQDQDI
ncbi:hypothetical protein [Priestia flexa]|uniref:hypothetical protein n=1 Tax=Priestia flexa TaxID=86664 RepID=UPI001CD25142|nr:hypothetical protein [Priestia flexa]MCA1202888.1 hypothetical protein [Priestia flexa]